MKLITFEESLYTPDIIIVLIIIFLTGITGGTINYFFSKPVKMEWPFWLQAVIIGIGAAFLMPLFLRTISSNLLANLFIENPKLDDYLVFSGFCLLAAISSRAFIQTLTDKILKEAREARLKAESSDKKFNEFRNQLELDRQALFLVESQLNLGFDREPPTQAELNDAIKQASDNARKQIFYQTFLIRTQNWRQNKERMTLTIPIFRALIIQDSRNQFHQNHGQLGYALRDMLEPNYKEAKTELDKAIRIRGERNTSHPHYEFVRAICNIKLLEEDKVPQNQIQKTKKEILSDLSKVAQTYLRIKIFQDNITGDWIKSNKIDLSIPI